MSDEKKLPAHEVILRDLERVTKALNACNPNEDTGTGWGYDIAIIKAKGQIQNLKQMHIPAKEIPVVCARLREFIGMCTSYDTKADWAPLLETLVTELESDTSEETANEST